MRIRLHLKSPPEPASMGGTFSKVDPAVGPVNRAFACGGAVNCASTLRSIATAASLLGLSIAAAGQHPAAGQDLREGVEFQANAYTAGTQRFPVVAVDAGGGFVVAWPSSGQDGSEDGVFLRRFSKTGASLAAELQVNSFNAGDQRGPNVAAEANGDFVVVWHS